MFKQALGKSPARYFSECEAGQTGPGEICRETNCKLAGCLRCGTRSMDFRNADGWS
jgi:hypothetical protein